MFAISKAMCSLTSDKLGLVTEASTAGIPPGAAPPDVVMVLDKNDQGFMFLRGETDRTEDNDIAGWNYRTNDGAFRLLIIND